MTDAGRRPAALGLAAWGETMEELCDAARAAEGGGFESVWLSELHRSALVGAAAVGAVTERVQVGTAIALAFARSELTTALSALDLADLTRGRFVLGLGPGVKRLVEDWHDRPYGKPVPHLRESVALIRRFMAEAHAGRPIVAEGEHVRARVIGYQRPFAPADGGVPVYLAAVGPVALRLSGSIADGWIAHELGSPTTLERRALPLLAEGLERGGRSRRDLRVVASACCVPDSDPHAAKRHAAGNVAFYATVKSYDEFFAFHGFLDEAKEIQRRFAAGEHDRMADACPDEMVDAFTLAGTPDEVRSRLAAYDGLADVVKLSPPTHLVTPEVTRRAQHAILEMFAT